MFDCFLKQYKILEGSTKNLSECLVLSDSLNKFEPLTDLLCVWVLIGNPWVLKNLLYYSLLTGFVFWIIINIYCKDCRINWLECFLAAHLPIVDSNVFVFFTFQYSFFRFAWDFYRWFLQGILVSHTDRAFSQSSLFFVEHLSLLKISLKKCFIN